VHILSVRPSRRGFERHRFLWLLLLFLLYPSALMLTRGAVLYLGLDAAAMGILAALLFVGRPHRVVALLLATIGAVALLTIVGATRSAQFAGSVPLLTIRTLLLLAFFGTITVVALAVVLRRERVTLDTVLGAVCAYLLLGATWGLLYDLLALIQPLSFRGPEPGTAAQSLSLADSLYFSYVTLTTVGYGDIVPTTVHARTLVWTEAVTGQIYIAVLVARLVSLQIVHSTYGTQRRVANSVRRARALRRRQSSPAPK
jgi:hypothetical protein